ncbi:MAG TPA: hypothetical protein VH475_25105 [Tepidisphaeraceae bacterium]|jgi:hypothetical protein
MRKTRTIVAVTLLATALCADRQVASAAAQSASARTEAGPVTPNFAQRLTVSLRRVVPTVKFHQARQDGVTPIADRAAFDGPQAHPHQTLGAPFQFRLPPPLA